jgi:hypothetical protein
MCVGLLLLLFCTSHLLDVSLQTTFRCHLTTPQIEHSREKKINKIINIILVLIFSFKNNFLKVAYLQNKLASKLHNLKMLEMFNKKIRRKVKKQKRVLEYTSTCDMNQLTLALLE